MRDIERESASVLLKPAGMENEYEIVEDLKMVCINNDLSIIWNGHLVFSYEQAFEFYAGNRGKWFRRAMAKQLSGGVILHGFEVYGRNAITILRDWVGSTDPAKAAAEEPDSPRGRFGRGNMKELSKTKQVVDNAVHVSTSSLDASREIPLMVQAAR